MIIEENSYGEGEKLPVCYTFFYLEKYYLLYTPNMTYLDGYEPFSGETKIPLLTENMIVSMSKEFYRRVNTIAIQTDSKIKKNKRQTLKIEGNRRGSQLRINNLNLTEIEKSKENEENKENEKTFDEESEDNNQESDESESNNSESEEKDSEFDLPVLPKQPGERTWERFQKKASEKQKERDQCGPAECLIY